MHWLDTDQICVRLSDTQPVLIRKIVFVGNLALANSLKKRLVLVIGKGVDWNYRHVGCTRCGVVEDNHEA